MFHGSESFVKHGSWNILLSIQSHSKRENKDEIRNYIFRLSLEKKTEYEFNTAKLFLIIHMKHFRGSLVSLQWKRRAWYQMWNKWTEVPIIEQICSK